MAHQRGEVAPLQVFHHEEQLVVRLERVVQLRHRPSAWGTEVVVIRGTNRADKISQIPLLTIPCPGGHLPLEADNASELDDPLPSQPVVTSLKKWGEDYRDWEKNEVFERLDRKSWEKVHFKDINFADKKS